jgi:hypothetical protein
VSTSTSTWPITTGARVEKTFLELVPELWDGETRRLTLLFDPGRIKRGLRPRQDLGSALIAGDRYSLVIEASLEDAEGYPLAVTARESFKVHDADRISPDPARWVVQVPVVGSRDTLRVLLDEAVDHALLERMLSVVGPDGESVNGEALVDEGETRWSLVQDEDWEAGSFSVRADVRLEDRAGNRLDVLFDQEMGQENREAPTDPFVLLPFEVGES